MYKFFKITSKWIGYLPFCGRVALKPALLSVFGCNGKDKFKNAIGAYVLLIFYILGHGFQAYMGYNLFKITNNHIISTISMIYCTANTLVTYAQIFLFIRLTIHCIKKLKIERRKTTVQKSIKDFSNKQIILFLIVTMGGQIIFFICSICQS